MAVSCLRELFDSTFFHSTKGHSTHYLISNSNENAVDVPNACSWCSAAVWQVFFNKNLVCSFGKFWQICHKYGVVNHLRRSCKKIQFLLSTHFITLYSIPGLSNSLLKFLGFMDAVFAKTVKLTNIFAPIDDCKNFQSFHRKWKP